MKAGTYYIGDPCYVLDEQNGFDWMEVLEDTNYFGLFASKRNQVENKYNPKHLQHGEFVIVNKDSQKFEVCASTTAYGDGMYTDKTGNKYPVDAGMLGAVPIEAIDVTKVGASGHIVTFTRDWNISYDDGIITFGDKVEIDTDD